MKRFSIFIICLCVSLTTIARCQNGNHWGRYQRRTLREVISFHQHSDVFKGMQSEKRAMLLTGDDFASQVRLIYMGQKRPVSGDRKAVLDAWRKSLGDHAPRQDEFKEEVLFKEGSREYWLVTQNALVAALPKELKKGSMVNAYVIWIGAINADPDWEWLFAINEFVSCPDPQQNCSIE